MDDVSELVIKAKCTELVTRYCKAVNHTDDEDFLAVWTEDCVWNRPVGAPMHGRAQIQAWLDQRVLDRVMRHVNGASLVKVVDDRHARGWSQTVVYGVAGTMELPARMELPTMVVEYEDWYELRGDEWLIARRDTTWVFLSDADPLASGRLNVLADDAEVPLS